MFNVLWAFVFLESDKGSKRLTMFAIAVMIIENENR